MTMNLNKSCQTCHYAVITLLAECSKIINDQHVHEGGLCPDEFICDYYKEGDGHDIAMNSINWNKAIKIVVD
jgi:hypothetical protein